MRFCLNCGGALPDAPIVVNFGQGTGSSNPGTNPYGQPTPSNPGSAPGTNPWGQQPQQQQPPPPQFGQQAPQYGQTPPPQQSYSMVPPAKGGGGSGKKIFIAVAGVFALFFLIVIAVVGIVGYNMYKSEQARLASTPTPTPTATTKPSASPSASKSASPSPSATPAEKTVSSDYSKVKINFKKVWVDYNVTEGDEMGMTVHVKYDVTKMKGIDSFAVIFFQKEDGTYLDNGTGTTKAKDGRVAIFKPLKPGFEPTAYEDLQIFVPYDALNLEPGNYKLKMDIDMTDLDENLVGHITFKEFEYEQK